VSTEFVYDLAGNVVAEFVGATWTKGYVHLGGQMLAQYDNTVTPATTFFAHQDHLGSTRLLTKMNQSVQECNDYYPFGELETSTCTPNPGTATTSHKFTGKERDTESGLDNFLARYMASNQGRFFSPDPGNASGLANLPDPQGWNGYSYVRNNPILYQDPTGMLYCSPVDGSQLGTNNSPARLPHCVTDSEFEKNPDNYKGYEWEPDPNPSAVVYAYEGATQDERIQLLAEKITERSNPWKIVRGAAFEIGSASASFVECLFGSCGVAQVAGLVPGISALPRNARDRLLRAAKHPRLRNIIGNLFRPDSRFGSGSAMDAARHELAGGARIAGKDHVKKLIVERQGLQKLLRDRGLSPSDRATVKELLIDIQNAMNGR